MRHCLHSRFTFNPHPKQHKPGCFVLGGRVVGMHCKRHTIEFATGPKRADITLVVVSAAQAQGWWNPLPWTVTKTATEELATTYHTAYS